MIRDPSDGSVRETVKHRPEPLKSKEVSPESDVLSTAASGLAPDHSNRADRLKKSRNWLQNYHQEKSHARRGNNEKQSQDGSSGHNQG